MVILTTEAEPTTREGAGLTVASGRDLYRYHITLDLRVQAHLSKEIGYFSRGETVDKR